MHDSSDAAFVDGFLRGCRELGLPETGIHDAMRKAAAIHPEAGEAFAAFLEKQSAFTERQVQLMAEEMLRTGEATPDNVMRRIRLFARRQGEAMPGEPEIRRSQVAAPQAAATPAASPRLVSLPPSIPAPTIAAPPFPSLAGGSRRVATPPPATAQVPPWASWTSATPPPATAQVPPWASWTSATSPPATSPPSLPGAGATSRNWLSRRNLALGAGGLASLGLGYGAYRMLRPAAAAEKAASEFAPSTAAAANPAHQLGQLQAEVAPYAPDRSTLGYLGRRISGIGAEAIGAAIARRFGVDPAAFAVAAPAINSLGASGYAGVTEAARGGLGAGLREASRESVANAFANPAGALGLRAGGRLGVLGARQAAKAFPGDGWRGRLPGQVIGQETGNAAGHNLGMRVADWFMPETATKQSFDLASLVRAGLSIGGLATGAAAGTALGGRLAPGLAAAISRHAGGGSWLAGLRDRAVAAANNIPGLPKHLSTNAFTVADLGPLVGLGLGGSLGYAAGTGAGDLVLGHRKQATPAAVVPLLSAAAGAAWPYLARAGGWASAQGGRLWNAIRSYVPFMSRGAAPAANVAAQGAQAAPQSLWNTFVHGTVGTAPFVLLPELYYGARSMLAGQPPPASPSPQIQGSPGSVAGGSHVSHQPGTAMLPKMSSLLGNQDYDANERLRARQSRIDQVNAVAANPGGGSSSPLPSRPADAPPPLPSRPADAPPPLPSRPVDAPPPLPSRPVDAPPPLPADAIVPPMSGQWRPSKRQLAIGLGSLAALGLTGYGVHRALRSGGDAKDAPEKRAFIDRAIEHWNALDQQSKVTAGLGGAVALGTLLNRLHSGESSTANTLTGLGGLGLAAYGLSGGRPVSAISNALHPQSAVPAATNRFLNADGTVRVQDVVRATDPELRSAIGGLSSSQRDQFRDTLKAFQPSTLQSLAARVGGIDIDAQRNRLTKLLS